MAYKTTKMPRPQCSLIPLAQAVTQEGIGAGPYCDGGPPGFPNEGPGLSFWHLELKGWQLRLWRAAAFWSRLV